MRLECSPQAVYQRMERGSLTWRQSVRRGRTVKLVNLSRPAIQGVEQGLEQGPRRVEQGLVEDVEQVEQGVEQGRPGVGAAEFEALSGRLEKAREENSELRATARGLMKEKEAETSRALRAEKRAEAAQEHAVEVQGRLERALVQAGEDKTRALMELTASLERESRAVGMAMVREALTADRAQLLPAVGEAARGRRAARVVSAGLAAVCVLSLGWGAVEVRKVRAAGAEQTLELTDRLAASQRELGSVEARAEGERATAAAALERSEQARASALLERDQAREELARREFVGHLWRWILAAVR